MGWKSRISNTMKSLVYLFSSWYCSNSFSFSFSLITHSQAFNEVSRRNNRHSGDLSGCSSLLCGIMLDKFQNSPSSNFYFYFLSFSRSFPLGLHTLVLQSENAVGWKLRHVFPFSQKSKTCANYSRKPEKCHLSYLFSAIIVYNNKVNLAQLSHCV